MERTFSLHEARELLPEARRRVAEAAAMTAELRRLTEELRAGGPSAAGGGIPEAKSLEARLDDALSWFSREGVQVKGIAPALLDFPARTSDGQVVLLCWLQGEDDLDWYHPVDTGFLGRAPIAGLDLAP